MTTKATRRHRKHSDLAVKHARKDKRRKARKAAAHDDRERHGAENGEPG